MTKDDIKKILKQGLINQNIHFDHLKIDKLIKYLEMLLDANKEINLTSITDPEEAIYKHFLDSLSVIPCLDIQNNIRIIDVGTGAGFPGIPVKIILDDNRITLIDSTNKKVNFLNSVVDQLQITNIDCIHARAEELARNHDHREQYDLVLSRALAPLNLLLELCIPFAKVGGLFIAYKSKEVHKEIEKSEKALKLLGGRIKDLKKVDVTGIEGERYLVIIEKTQKNLSAYPRKPGMPQKRPLE